MNYLTQNTKIKKSEKRTFNFPLVAIKTCPFAGKCKAYCYANKGTYRFSNVRKKHEANFEATKSDEFAIEMLVEIIEKQAERIRIHDSGDFYSQEYFHKWIEIANALPHVEFYAYTKSIPYFAYVTLPDNLKLIQSVGGLNDSWVNTNKRHAVIYKNEGEKQFYLDNGYIDASDNDDLALTDNHKIMLKFH